MKNTRPTRAEASDISNAVIDGVDCLQLDKEVIHGANPFECIKMLSKCAVEAEQTLNYSRLYQDITLS